LHRTEKQGSNALENRFLQVARISRFSSISRNICADICPARRAYQSDRVEHNRVMASSKGGMRCQESVALDELRRIRWRATHTLGNRIGPSQDIPALALESLATSYIGRGIFP
jgi:glutamate dehydrogenase/leucine dehydrogenase